MADPVLELDLQNAVEWERQAAEGDEKAAQRLFFLCSGWAGKQTKWQWCIHGDTTVYRQRAVRWLVREGKYRQARRFALCGRGDVGMVGDAEGSVRVSPRGCGARFCPRCSRRGGRRFLSRVASHLSSAPHGELFHMVLTQRVIGEETLEESMARFGKAWVRFYGKLRKLGMRSALATYHVVPSNSRGWHYHCHLLVELREGVVLDDVYAGLDEAWFRACKDREEGRKAVFVRVLTWAGAALAGLAEDTQMEFWSESKDPVEVVLQYVLRDILQGVEKWIGRIHDDDGAEAFAKALGCSKLHRLYGAWRKKVAGEDVDEGEGAAAVETASKGDGGKLKECESWVAVGVMDQVLWQARSGGIRELDLLRRLIGRSLNRGAVGSRLSMLVKGFAL